MRYPVLAVTAAALFTLSACGSSSSGDESLPSIGGPAAVESATPTPTPSPTPTPAATPVASPPATPAAEPKPTLKVSPRAIAKPVTPKGATSAQARSTIADVTAYAPVLEQIFRGKPYPRTLAEVVRAANRIDNLRLSKGNRFGAYRYDASDVEFRLCVENVSGAYATYDTRPMTTVQSGRSGGCV